MRGFWANELNLKHREGLYRSRRQLIPDPERADCVIWQGQQLVNAAANDYLGLARDARLAHAAARVQRSHGTGAGASPLITGWLPIHRALERDLARHESTDKCLLFPSGFAANLAAISALAGPDDLILSDSANHASLIDGCRLSHAQTLIYQHGMAEIADKELRQHRASYKRAWIVTDSVFSMDGDTAPLADLARVAHRHDAGIIVDEAHATGVMGPDGRGLSAELSPDAVPAGLVRVGTLSKALGSQGGFVAADRSTIDWLVNQGRSYLFSTALAPGAAAAARMALKISEKEPDRRLRVLALAARLRSFLQSIGRPVPGLSPIIPVVAGNEHLAVEWSNHCRSHGFLVAAVRYPSVPRGLARLRISLSANHRDEDMSRLEEALATVPAQGA